MSDNDLEQFVLRFQEANREFTLTYLAKIKQFRLTYRSDTQFGTTEGSCRSNLYFDSEGRLVKP